MVKKINQKKRGEAGLLSELLKRLGMFKYIAKYARGPILRSLASCLIYSKLCFSMPIFSNIWEKELYIDKDTRTQIMTKEDVRKL